MIDDPKSLAIALTAMYVDFLGNEYNYHGVSIYPLQGVGNFVYVVVNNGVRQEFDNANDAADAFANHVWKVLGYE